MNKLFLVFLASLILYGCNNHVAPIENGATDMTSAGKEYKKFIPLFKNAAEIVRRDSKCKRVQLVDISLSKSTVENPVFMVICDDKNNRLFNTFVPYFKVKNYQPTNGN